MGQAFDRDGNVLGEAFGNTKREVFDKLNAQFKDADAIHIKTLRERVESASGPTTEMPRYRCHKEVWALKIRVVERDDERARMENRETDGSAMLYPDEDGYAGVKVNADYVRKHNPQPGGYYVVYKDGYKSFSPADAFEDGYTKI